MSRDEILTAESISRMWSFSGETSGTFDKESTLERTVKEVFQLLRTPVYRYLLGIVGNRTDAEDLAQETFVRLFNHLRAGHDVRNLRGFVFQIAHNLAVDFNRRPENGKTEDGDCERIDPEPDAERAVLAKEKLERFLISLSPQERRCVELRAEGLCYREIGEVLGIRIPTVQTLLNRAVKKISGPKS